MKHRLLLNLTLLGLFFTSCWQAPQPPAAREVKVLATVQATLETNGAASAQLVPNTRSSRSALPDTAISFTRKFSSMFEDESSKQRYLSATFEVQNTSGQDFKNLTLYAYTQAASAIGGSAIKKMVNFGLEPINSPSVAQNIKPTHGMKHLGANVLVNSDEADFQAFKFDEASAVQDAARTLGTIQNNDEVLEYGYVTRSALGGRTIGNNGKGYVTIAVRLPKQTDKSIDPYKFVMTFVLADDALTRVTRSAEESTSEAENRAADLNANEVVLIGPDLDTVAGKTTIRVPNVKISNAPVSLLESKLFLISVAPLEISNDQTTPITVTGQEFSADTSFFLESTKLEVTSLNPNRATLNIPAGFEPANYGLMAVNPDGSRATLYPGFSIKAGTPTRAIDPQLRARSFVDGYVIDYKTQQPLSEAKISLWNGTGTLEASTDTNGYFLIRGVPAGVNTFKIDHTGYESVYRNANVLGDAQTVTLQLSALEPSNTNTKSIDATGGTYYANGLNPDDGFLVVPSGALEKPTNIRFTQLHAPETLPELPQNNLFTAFAKLEPSGLVFKKPATLFLPIANDLNRTAGQTVPALYFDTQQSKWVNEITSGVISSINGKLFLEYEITHFSYGGGGVPGGGGGSNVRGCVFYDNNTPAYGITTNWGKTDPDGEFRDRVRSLKPGSMQIAKVIGNGDAVPVTATVDESGNIDFPCIRIPTPTPGSPTKPSLDTVDPCQSPAPPINFGAPSPIQTRNQTRASSNPQLVTAQSLKGTTSEIPNYRKYNIDPSKTTLTIGGIDFTSKAVIVPNPNNTENLLVTLVLPEPLKALANLEFKLSVETKEGKKAESSSFADVVAKFDIQSVTAVVVPNNKLPASEVTPIIADGPQGRLVMFREQDLASDGTFTTNVIVRALDEQGKVMRLNSVQYVIFPELQSSSEAQFIDGIAHVPVKFRPASSITKITKISFSSTPKLAAFATRQTRINCDNSDSIKLEKPVQLGLLENISSLPVLSNVLDWINGWTGNTLCVDRFCISAGQAIGLGWGIIPGVGDGTTLLDNFVKALNGEGADPVEVFLAGLGLALDFTPGGQVLGALPGVLIQVSRIAKGAGTDFISRVLKDAIETCKRLKLNPIECAQRLQDDIGEIARIFTEGGEIGVKAFEKLASGLRTLPCPTGRMGIKSQSPSTLLCDEAKIRQIVTQIAKNAFSARVSSDRVFDELYNVCCDGNYIPGAENLVQRASTANQDGLLVGIVAEARAASSLRNSGWNDVSIPEPEEFIINGNPTTADFFAKDPQGIYRVFEVKNDGMLTREQEQYLLGIAAQTGAKPSFISLVGLNNAQLSALRRVGIDVFDVNGVLLNP